MAKYKVEWGLVRPWIIKEYSRLDELARFILADALEFVEEKVSRKPMSFGEPHYRYKSADLIYCVGFHSMLRIEYGVHKSSHTVFISKLSRRQSK